MSEPPLFPGKRISGDGDLMYGAMHPFPLPVWRSPDVIRTGGQNWQVIFNLEKAGYLEANRGGTVTKRDLAGPTQGFAEPADAVRTQKPIIDSVPRALLMLQVPGKPLLLPPVWEGVFRKPSPERIVYEVHRVEATALSITAGQLHGWGKEWSEFDPLSVSQATGFALRWFYRGMIDFHNEFNDRIDAFVSLWISTITLVREWHARTIGGDPGSEVNRFVAYADHRLLLEVKLMMTS